MGANYFGLVLSLGVYFLCMKLQKRLKIALLNPLLCTILVIFGFLLVSGMDYQFYNTGAKQLTYLLTPATVCLAIPMYRQIEVLKKQWLAIGVSVLAGCIACAISILGIAVLLKLDPVLYHSLQAKSITTAIAVGVTDEIGGISSITVLAVIITGLTGAVLARPMCKWFHVTDPVAVGLAIGSSSHAIGTTTALTIGEVEGAMSGLAIVVAGIMTVVIAPLMAGFL